MRLEYKRKLKKNEAKKMDDNRTHSTYLARSEQTSCHRGLRKRNPSSGSYTNDRARQREHPKCKTCKPEFGARPQSFAAVTTPSTAPSRCCCCLTSTSATQQHRRRSLLPSSFVSLRKARRLALSLRCRLSPSYYPHDK